jgi:transcriptional regulator with XRE-family HTH domain
MNFLGKNIRYLRKQSSKTQTDLAVLINKGQTTIGNWENQISEPNVEELLIISNYFGIPVDLLLKEDIAQRDLHKNAGGSDEKLSRKSSVKYAQPEEFQSVVKDKEDTTLAYVLKEVKAMRDELELIKRQMKMANG